MKLLKLVSEKGRWAYLDNSQIYKYVVYLLEEKDVYKYKEVNELGETLSIPSKENIVY